MKQPTQVDVDRGEIKTESLRQRLRYRLGDYLYYGFVYLMLLAGAALIFVPLWWAVSSAFKPPQNLFLDPPQWIPQPWTFENFRAALDAAPFWTFAKNTMIICAWSVLGEVLSTSMAAYAFARLRFRGRDALFLVLLATMMLPSIIKLIPTFIIFSKLGWVNTFLPLIVPHFLATPIFVFLLRQFFATIPLQMDEAARVDGASFYRIYWDIILPLSRPALAVVAIFTFLGEYENFFGPLIYINSTDKFTLALGLNLFKGMFTVDFGPMMAVSVLMLLPPVLLFVVAQRYFIQGIVVGGVKG
ncbi:MAG: carbohydrate ABC transporter permease [Thermomicrobiales bacterium]